MVPKVWPCETLLLAAVLVGDASANFASADLPHPHSGKLTPYEIGKPSILLSPSDEAQVRRARARRSQRTRT